MSFTYLYISALFACLHVVLSCLYSSFLVQELPARGFRLLHEALHYIHDTCHEYRRSRPYITIFKSLICPTAGVSTYSIPTRSHYQVSLPAKGHRPYHEIFTASTNQTGQSISLILKQCSVLSSLVYATHVLDHCIFACSSISTAQCSAYVASLLRPPLRLAECCRREAAPQT